MKQTKTAKGALLFASVWMALSSCFDQEQFPSSPHITLQKVYFKEYGSTFQSDSLVVSLNFQDGNGDLGLPSWDTNFPFHSVNYFLNNGTANGDSVGTFTGVTAENPPREFSPIIFRNADQAGKLATLKKIGEPGFGFMDPYVYPQTCLNYLYDTLYVQEGDADLIDASYNIVDTIRVLVRTNPEAYVNLYVVAETFYFRKNPVYYNINVQFYEILADGQRKLFNWETLRPGECGQTFDGRFPVLNRTDADRPLEGVLTYAMQSNGFIPLLGEKTWQLDIQVTDRSLATSNVVSTQPFRLTEIREE